MGVAWSTCLPFRGDRWPHMCSDRGSTEPNASKVETPEGRAAFFGAARSPARIRARCRPSRNQNPPPTRQRKSLESGSRGSHERCHGTGFDIRIGCNRYCGGDAVSRERTHRSRCTCTIPLPNVHDNVNEHIVVTLDHDPRLSIALICDCESRIRLKSAHDAILGR